MTESIHTPEMQSLRQWLRSERESRCLTMRNLAASMGKPHSYIQKVEEGERRLDVVEFIWYCMALGVDPGEGIKVAMSAISLPDSP